jgi:large subunit ribosomal protein L19
MTSQTFAWQAAGQGKSGYYPAVENRLERLDFVYTINRVHHEKVVVMSIHPIMQKLAAKFERTDLPNFAPGDTVRVQVKIKEGEKERLQAFEGMVIACRKGAQGSFTVRKMSFGQGVERIFPYNSKVVDKVEKIRSYEVRRSKLFYLRALRGKAARLREVERAK